MNCPLCGYSFTENEGETACGRCFLAHSCELVKCPNCGYETPREPGWLKALRKILRRKNDGIV